MNIIKDSHFWIGILVGWLFLSQGLAMVKGLTARKA